MSSELVGGAEDGVAGMAVIVDARPSGIAGGVAHARPAGAGAVVVGRLALLGPNGVHCPATGDWAAAWSSTLSKLSLAGVTGGAVCQPPFSSVGR